MTEGFRSPSWLPGGHWQTLYSEFILSVPSPHFRYRTLALGREASATVAEVGDPVRQPTVLLFTGVHGQARSHYSKALAQHCAVSGWACVSASIHQASIPRLLRDRLESAADYSHHEHLLKKLVGERGGKPIFVVAVSLSAYTVTKMLASARAPWSALVYAYAAVSAPLDIEGTYQRITSMPSLGYRLWDLRQVKRKMRRESGSYFLQGRRPSQGLQSAVDDLVGVNVPTLLLNARNDPCLSPESFPTSLPAGGQVELDYPEGGGHMGFVHGAFPGRYDWFPRRVVEFFRQRAEPGLCQ